jgi:hypothetical protein
MRTLADPVVCGLCRTCPEHCCTPAGPSACWPVLQGADSFEVAALLFSKVTMSEAERIPDMHPLTDSRWEATCGRCLRHSAPAKAVTPENAWRDLKAIGWSFHVSQYGGRGYALCPTCTQNPETVDDAVKAAKKGRKRR